MQPHDLTPTDGVSWDFIDQADAGDVDAVSGSQDFTGTSAVGMGVTNFTETSQTGVSTTFDTSSSGLDTSQMSWWYFFYNSTDATSEGSISIPCTSPSSPSTSEICPSDAALSPNEAYWTVADPISSATFDTGFDVSRSYGTTDDNGDTPVSVTVTPDDPRYAGNVGADDLRVTTFNDNYVPGTASVIGPDGTTPLASCTTPLELPCLQATQNLSYAYPLASGGTTACDSVDIEAWVPQYDGTEDPYTFTFDENSNLPSLCPIGMPGLNVTARVNFQDKEGPVPCDASSTTDCIFKADLSGFGAATVDVPGNSLQGFTYTPAQSWTVSLDSESAPPPPSATSVGSASGSSSDTPPVQATDGGTTVTGNDGSGTIVVAQYGSDPVKFPPIGADGTYFDVQLAGASFASVTIQDCNPQAAFGDQVVWWDGSQWQPVLSDPGGDNFEFYGGASSPYCATMILSADTQPAIDQLTGTVFAVALPRRNQAPLSVTSLTGTVGTPLALTTAGGSGSGQVNFTVSNGSASGCYISDGYLTASSSGTCVVTATKAGDNSYFPVSSPATDVTLSYGPPPAPVSVSFTRNSASLSSSDKRTLNTLLAKLYSGASLTIVAYAHANRSLATRRAAAVATYLATRQNLVVARHVVTATHLNVARVTTNSL